MTQQLVQGERLGHLRNYDEVSWKLREGIAPVEALHEAQREEWILRKRINCHERPAKGWS